MILCYHQTAMVNTLCHGGNLGYRNFETKDESKNIQWLAYFTFGQSLHNNHHAFPAKANYANGNHEIDPGYILSKLIRFKERL
jgi:stearoyl-CoA desaturase (delta-9 desaturase)